MSAALAKIIRARRFVRGMDRQDLATVVGCDVRTVRRWEYGSRPLARHIVEFREQVGISIEEMARIMIETIRGREGGLQIEGDEYLRERELSHSQLAEKLLSIDQKFDTSEFLARSARGAGMGADLLSATRYLAGTHT